MITASIGSGLESDVEDNTSEADPVPEKPLANKLDIDDDLPSTVTLLRTAEGGKCYLLGTAHFSLESQNDVSKVYILVIVWLYFFNQR